MVYLLFQKIQISLQPEAVVAVTNEPSNEARALLMLQSAGLITLKTGTAATIASTTEAKLAALILAKS